jgi:DNA-binding MarR family transcriptional regulator
MTRHAAPDHALKLGDLPKLIGYHIRLAQVAIFKDFDATLGSEQVTPGVYGVLTVIDANPGLKQTELAAAVQLDRSTVVTVIDKLEKRCVVERRPAPGDRRSNALFLTDAGKQMLSRLRPKVRQHETRLTEQLTTEERATLIRLLDKIFPEHR